MLTEMKSQQRQLVRRVLTAMPETLLRVRHFGPRIKVKEWVPEVVDSLLVSGKAIWLAEEVK